MFLYVNKWSKFECMKSRCVHMISILKVDLRKIKTARKNTMFSIQNYCKPLSPCPHLENKKVLLAVSYIKYFVYRYGNPTSERQGAMGGPCGGSRHICQWHMGHRVSRPLGGCGRHCCMPTVGYRTSGNSESFFVSCLHSGPYDCLTE